MLILGNYDACYHSFMNFLHWYAILLKFIFIQYLGLIMCFIDDWYFSRLNDYKLTTFLEFFDFSRWLKELISRKEWWDDIKYNS